MVYADAGGNTPIFEVFELPGEDGAGVRVHAAGREHAVLVDRPGRGWLRDRPVGRGLDLLHQRLEEPPPPPVLSWPSDASMVDHLDPTLEVIAVVDPDGDDLTYDIVVLTDTSRSSRVTGLVEEDVIIRM